MSKRETFILTLFFDPLRDSKLRGRVRHVATGLEATFVGGEELTAVLRELIQRGEEVKDESSDFAIHH